MTRKTLLWAAAGLGAAVLAVVLLAPLLVPTEALRGEIERRISAETGRRFQIHGGLAFSLFPDIGLTAQDVTLANAPGGKARDMVTIAAMRIGVKLRPLLSGRIEATGIALDHPRIALEVAADGAPNWKLVPRAASGPRLGPPPGTVFDGVTVTDGAVSYDNARLGIHRTLGDVDAKIAITRLEQPTGITGAVSYRGRRLNYAVTVNSPKTLLQARTAKLRAAVDAGAFFHAGFLGDLAGDGTLAGDADLRAASLKDVAAWLGMPVTAGTGLNAVAARAKLTAKDRGVALSHIVARLDGMNVSGDLEADLRGKRPAVTGVLAIDRLDLNTYIRLDGAPPRPTGANTNPSPNPVKPRLPGPPSGGWSKAPIRLDLVRLLDGRLTLDVGGLAVRHLKLGRSTILLTLAQGLMTAHVAPLQLYGGTGQADLVVDARDPLPTFANKLNFTGIAMGPFLADAIGVDKIAAKGDIALDVTSKGTSPDAIMRALAGKGAVALGRGSIHGVDMGRVARTVENILSAGATGDGATTAFDRFAGSFTIANGMLANNDLKLSSAFVNMTGAGHLDLGNQTILYRIEPKASIGGKLHLLDIGVPFAITGSWAHLVYKPDIAGAITGLVGSVLGKGAATLGGLFNALAGPATTPPPDKKKKSKSVGDRLKTMFGLH